MSTNWIANFANIQCQRNYLRKCDRHERISFLFRPNLMENRHVDRTIVKTLFLRLLQLITVQDSLFPFWYRYIFRWLSKYHSEKLDEHQNEKSLTWISWTVALCSSHCCFNCVSVFSIIYHRSVLSFYRQAYDRYWPINSIEIYCDVILWTWQTNMFIIPYSMIAVRSIEWFRFHIRICWIIFEWLIEECLPI